MNESTKITTIAKEAHEQINEILYQDTGLYQPWQLAERTVVPLLLDGVYEDLLTYWSVDGSLRPDFAIKDNVSLPVFWLELQGVTQERQDYFALVKMLKTSAQYVFYQSTQIAPRSINDNNVSYLAEGSLSETIFSAALWQPLTVLSEAKQRNMLRAVNQTINSISCQHYQFTLTDDLINALLNSISASESLINCLKSYDYGKAIPKIILYLRQSMPLAPLDGLYLNFWHQIGFDIIVLSPDGGEILRTVFASELFTTIHLEDVAANLILQEPRSTKPSFWQKLLARKPR